MLTVSISKRAQGRGYPDLAALAHNYYIEIGGNEGAISGTSAAAPVVAGLIGLLNNYRSRWASV
jgi:tripeptidyl-peptidase-1